MVAAQRQIIGKLDIQTDAFPWQQTATPNQMNRYQADWATDYRTGSSWTCRCNRKPCVIGLSSKATGMFSHLNHLNNFHQPPQRLSMWSAHQWL